MDFETLKPINTSLYFCDNKFHTEALKELLESEDKYGFIVMDISGTLFGTLCSNTGYCSLWNGNGLGALYVLYAELVAGAWTERCCTNSR